MKSNIKNLELTRSRRGALSDDADKILKQSNGVDVNNVGQLVDLVERNQAQVCLARVICDLSRNTRAYGDNGSKFAQSLLKFRQSKHPKVKFYMEAMSNGAKAKNNEQCKTHYPKCNHQATEVIDVGNRILKAR